MAVRRINPYKREIAYLSASDPILKRVIKKIGLCMLVPDRKRSLFEALVRAIAHQQLHGKAAEKILGRFVDLFPLKKSERFPSARAVLKTPSQKLRKVGFSHAKIKSILDIARRAVKGDIPTNAKAEKMTDNELIETLLPLRGVGQWTVEMILIFTLGRLDVLPVDDFGVREGFRLAYKKRTQPTPKALRIYGKRWSPYRTIASWYMWAYLLDSRKKK